MVQERLLKFFSKYKKQVFRKNEILISPGDRLKNVYFIIEGTVRLYAISPEGEEITLHFFQKNTYIPMMIILAGSENKYYFEAVSETSAFIAPSEDVIDLLKNDNEILFELTQRLSEGLTGFLTRTEYFMTSNAYIKVASLLLYMMDKFGEKKENTVELTIPLTHHDLAAWIGVSRETASRQLEKLTKEKIISTTHHRITVLQPQKLKEIHHNAFLEE